MKTNIINYLRAIKVKRITFLLVLFLSMSVSMMGQNQMVNLDKTTTTVRQLISAIEKQTNMSVDYGQNTLNLAKQVKVNSKSEKLSVLRAWSIPSLAVISLLPSLSLSRPGNRARSKR